MAETQSVSALDAVGRAMLFTEARTARTFASTPVTDDELTQIWNLAKWAPTAANIQPLRVLYIRPGAGRDRLVEHMNEGNKAKTGTAPAVAVLAVDTEFHRHIPTIFPIRPELEAMYAGNDALRTESAQFNATLQAGYFILAVRALGLAAGPQSGFDASGLDAEFFADGRFRSILVVNIGHPGENAWMDRLPRLDRSDVITWA